MAKSPLGRIESHEVQYHRMLEIRRLVVEVPYL